MNKEKIVPTMGLTYDDVLLIPQYSQVLPRNVSTKTKLTEDISLEIPILSAAMDTVTDARMAIAMARLGGLGVIHKNFTTEQQASEVRKVKRWRNGFIIDPVTLLDTQTMQEAIEVKDKHSFTSFPVVNQQGIFVGLITSKDFDLLEDPNLLVKNVMTPVAELIIVEKLVTLEEAHALMRRHRLSKLPIVTDSGKLHALVTLKDIKKSKDYPLATLDPQGQLRVGAAVGVSDDLHERISLLITAGVDVIFIDTAHGHSHSVLDAIKDIKHRYPKLPIVAGNIATGKAATALRFAGVDAVKVGVGPGSICTTRIVAGVGVPQITAIIEVAEALAGTNIKIIADGGIKQTGDVTKALAAGADCIMAGSLFAGTDEAPGEMVVLEGRKYKSYRGMGSLGAMEDGSKDRYFQAGVATKKLVPEGIEGIVPYTGTVAEIILQYVGGLRSGMGYCGAPNIDVLKQTQFIQISNAGLNESHPHSVLITKASPNYRSK